MDSMKTPVFMYCVALFQILKPSDSLILNLEVFEALLVIKKLLVKKTGCCSTDFPSLFLSLLN